MAITDGNDNGGKDMAASAFPAQPPSVVEEAKKTFGETIQRLRQQSGLSQDQLGHDSGITATEMKEMEAGRLDTKLFTIIRLANRLGATVEELLRGIPQRPLPFLTCKSVILGQHKETAHSTFVPLPGELSQEAQTCFPPATPHNPRQRRKRSRRLVMCFGSAYSPLLPQDPGILREIGPMFKLLPSPYIIWAFEPTEITGRTKPMFIDRVMDICDRIMRQTADQRPTESNEPVVSPQLQRDSDIPTVLLVEDEPTLLQGFRDALEQSGYTVLTASSGESAINICGKHIGRIDVLVCDIVMDRLTGFDVAATVKAAHPNVRAILMSGSPLSGFVQHGGTDRFLQKPFAQEQLLTAVQSTEATLKPETH